MFSLSRTQLVSSFVLRSVGFIFFLAFSSVLYQYRGLHSCEGLEPVSSLIFRIFENNKNDNNNDNGSSKLGPILAIVNAANHPAIAVDIDSWLYLIIISGMISSTLVAIGISWFFPMLVTWVLYHVIFTVGQTFMSFQWDILLLETGFICIFMCSLSPFELKFKSSSSFARRYLDVNSLCPILLRWLLFRLMFQSGVVKLQSGCDTWSSLTATIYHFATQCIPTPLAWYASQFPVFFQKFGVALTLYVEILCPFAIIIPGPKFIRFVAAYSQIFLQILIIITGNYTFFNFLTIILSVAILDDRYVPFSKFSVDDNVHFLPLPPHDADADAAADASTGIDAAADGHHRSRSQSRSCESSFVRILRLVSKFVFFVVNVVAFSSLFKITVPISSFFSVIDTVEYVFRVAKESQNIFHFLNVLFLNFDIQTTFTVTQVNTLIAYSLVPLLLVVSLSLLFVFTFQLSLLFFVLYTSPFSLRNLSAFLTSLSRLLFIATASAIIVSSSALTLESINVMDTPSATASAALGQGDAFWSLRGLTTRQDVKLLAELPKPWTVTSSYGLFRRMTGVGRTGRRSDGTPLYRVARPELIIEGSNDTVSWHEYSFLYKPGDVDRAPPFVAPYQPRLDWQMWFAALQRDSQPGWYIHLIYKLLIGEESVLKLMGPQPTQLQVPPKYIRAVLYSYDFTHSPGFVSNSTRSPSSWWRRKIDAQHIGPIDKNHKGVLDFLHDHNWLRSSSSSPHSKECGRMFLRVKRIEKAYNQTLPKITRPSFSLSSLMVSLSSFSLSLSSLLDAVVAIYGFAPIRHWITAAAENQKEEQNQTKFVFILFALIFLTSLLQGLFHFCRSKSYRRNVKASKN